MEKRVGDNHLSFANGAHEVNQSLVVMDSRCSATGVDDGIVCRIAKLTLSAAKHVADVGVESEVVLVCAIASHEGVIHQHPVVADLSAADSDLGLARALFQRDIANGILCGMIRIIRVIKRIQNIVPFKLAYSAHLAAAEDGAENLGMTDKYAFLNRVGNDNLGVFDQRDEQCRGFRVIVNTLHAALAAAEHIAHGMLGKVLDEGHSHCGSTRIRYLHRSVVANRAAVHFDEHVTVFRAVFALFVGKDVAEEVDARQGKTTAAEDGAVDLAAAHVDGDVAAHTTSIVVGLTVVAASAEDVAVVTRGALGAHKSVIIIGMDIAQHVAVLGTAEGAAPQAVGMGAVVHGHIHRHNGIVHVSELVIEAAIRAKLLMMLIVDIVLVDALSAAKHIAIDTVQSAGDVDGVSFRGFDNIS